VDEVALVDRRDHEGVLGVLHRLGPQDVLDEVAVRAVGPPLEPRRRHHEVDRRRHGEAGEVAVEAGERGAPA
jgi:hypothetical protein